MERVSADYLFSLYSGISLINFNFSDLSVDWYPFPSLSEHVHFFFWRGSISVNY